MNRRKTDNRGLSLIELVAVIAIIGILSVGAVNVFGLLSNASAKETATKLKTVMTEARTETMSKASASLQIYADDNGYYAQMTVNTKTKDPVKIGDSKVDVTYTHSNEIDNPISLKEKPMTVTFDRDTGAFQKIGEVNGQKVYYKTITVTSGRRTYTLTCERLTGKIIVE